MKVKTFFLTNVGTIRKNNEDSLLVFDKVISQTSLDKVVGTEFEGSPLWFVVADGMGGEEAGEEASGEVLGVLKDGFGSLTSPAQFEPLLMKAKARLDRIAEAKHIRLGTTLSGLFLAGPNSFVFNVGDCRVYKVTGGYLNRLTKDHSLVEEASAGGIPAANLPQNIVTSAVVGGDSEPMKVFVRPLQPRPGDRFLICSDGLWGAVPVERMEEGFGLPKSEETAELLFREALKTSKDNIGFMLVQVSAT